MKYRRPPVTHNWWPPLREPDEVGDARVKQLQLRPSRAYAGPSALHPADQLPGFLAIWASPTTIKSSSISIMTDRLLRTISWSSTIRSLSLLPVKALVPSLGSRDARKHYVGLVHPRPTRLNRQSKHHGVYRFKFFKQEEPVGPTWQVVDFSQSG